MAFSKRTGNTQSRPRSKAEEMAGTWAYTPGGPVSRQTANRMLASPFASISPRPLFGMWVCSQDWCMPSAGVSLLLAQENDRQTAGCSSSAADIHLPDMQLTILLKHACITVLRSRLVDTSELDSGKEPNYIALLSKGRLGGPPVAI